MSLRHREGLVMANHTHTWWPNGWGLVQTGLVLPLNRSKNESSCYWSDALNSPHWLVGKHCVHLVAVEMLGVRHYIISTEWIREQTDRDDHRAGWHVAWLMIWFLSGFITHIGAEMLPFVPKIKCKWGRGLRHNQKKLGKCKRLDAECISGWNYCVLCCHSWQIFTEQFVILRR